MINHADYPILQPMLKVCYLLMVQCQYEDDEVIGV